MDVKLSNSKLNKITGQAKSIHTFIIIGLGGLFIIFGAFRVNIFDLELNSLYDIWDTIKTEILLLTGFVMIIAGCIFNKGLLLNADMWGYISKRKMKKILKNCEIVDAQLTGKTTFRKVKRWTTPMTEYHFILNNNNSNQARYGSFDNRLFKDPDIMESEKPNVCRAYWNPKYPKLIVPAFLLDE
jgi:hypothetical protein